MSSESQRRQSNPWCVCQRWHIEEVLLFSLISLAEGSLSVPCASRHHSSVGEISRVNSIPYLPWWESASSASKSCWPILEEIAFSLKTPFWMYQVSFIFLGWPVTWRPRTKALPRAQLSSRHWDKKFPWEYPSVNCPCSLYHLDNLSTLSFILGDFTNTGSGILLTFLRQEFKEKQNYSQLWLSWIISLIIWCFRHRQTDFYMNLTVILKEMRYTMSTLRV